jgi:hypothetical protein
MKYMMCPLNAICSSDSIVIYFIRSSFSVKPVLACMLACSHIFCEECISEWLTRDKAATCPMCRAQIQPPGKQPCHGMRLYARSILCGIV